MRLGDWGMGDGDGDGGGRRSEEGRELEKKRLGGRRGVYGYG